MWHLKQMRGLLVAVVFYMLGVTQVFALAFQVIGNRPLDRLSSPAFGNDWPKGVVETINQKARVYIYWGDGAINCYFRGDESALNAALEDFAKVEQSLREVCLWPGEEKTRSFDKTEIPYTWMYGMPGHLGLKSWMEEVSGPTHFKYTLSRVTVYVGGLDLAKLKVPRGVTLRTPAEVRDMLLADLESKERKVRAAAARSLANVALYYDEVIPRLIAVVDTEQDAHVRNCAVVALGTLGGRARDAIPSLEREIKDMDPRLDRYHMESLKKIKLDQGELFPGDPGDLIQIEEFVKAARKKAGSNSDEQ